MSEITRLCAAFTLGALLVYGSMADLNDRATARNADLTRELESRKSDARLWQNQARECNSKLGPLLQRQLSEEIARCMKTATFDHGYFAGCGHE